MKLIKNLFQQFPFYPMLIGLYPVLFLWADNFVQVRWVGVARSLLIISALTIFVYLLFLVVLRNWAKSAAIAGLALALFFTFGQFFDVVNKIQVFGHIFQRYRNMLFIWGALFAAGFVWIVHTKSNLRNLTGTLNLVSSVLIAFTLVELGYDTIVTRPENVRIIDTSQNSQAISTEQADQTDHPDVYYIVLDGYDRADLLEKDFNLDNSQFISELEALGFVVPDCTTSNYNNTVTSMGATLNLNYLDTFGYRYEDLAKTDIIKTLAPLTLNNLVMQKFRALGYKIITLKTIWPFVDFPHSDIVYNVQSDTGVLGKMEAYKFQYTFMMTTLMRAVILKMQSTPELFANLPSPVLDLINPYYNYNQINGQYALTYKQNLYQLYKLESVAQVTGKKFLYAHLMVTHTPYVFTTTGKMREVIEPEEPSSAQTNEEKHAVYKVPYKDQIIYLNSRILKIVKNILTQSKIPPIIILQSDHGNILSGQKDDRQFEILNAYYLPQNAQEKVYPNITPVNTFRLIFSTFFNQDYPLLPDQSIQIGKAFPGGMRILPQTCAH